MNMLLIEKKTNWKNLLRFPCIIAMFVAVSHCASITSSPGSSEAKEAAVDKTITWEQREQRLQSISHWNNQGAISVRTPETSGSASLNWQQTANHYNIRIFGPLGSGQVLLDGSPSQVTLTTAKGEKFSASSAEQLLSEQTGWYLPVSNLNYWIRGLPAPGSIAQTQLDSGQRLQKLSQQGWTIQYNSYRTVSGIDLPRSMNLSNGTVQAKIVINRWRI